ncbi:MAG: hypothetical protein ACFFDH_00030 [Promethearchaeota archaeon]
MSVSGANLVAATDIALAKANCGCLASIIAKLFVGTDTVKTIGVVPTTTLPAARS